MTTVRTATIIGGGIAGPVVAMALRKAGIEATVYEAYPSTPEGIGGSLAIAPNGVAALEVVGAVHVPSNSSGQGASLAIESGIQLARCLRDLPDVPAAFAAYERLRRDRVEKVAARAARINQTKAPGRIAQALMPILMPLLIKSAMNPEKTFGPEQRHRIDWDAHVH